MKENWKIIHYINQFFAGIGGEEEARTGLSEVDGPIGPGRALETALNSRGSIISTIYCGDDYFVENQDETIDQVVNIIAKHKPDLFIAGPAFNAGRYGQACGALCSAVGNKFKIPSITSMYPENPGVGLFNREGIYMIEAPKLAKGLPDIMSKMVNLGIKLLRNEKIGDPGEEGYIPRGIKKNAFVKKTSAERALDMLLDKVKGSPFLSEISQPKFDKVSPASPIKDLTQATIALLTDGGVVPKGNPDNLASASGHTFGKYSMEGLNNLSGDFFESIHAGINNKIGSEDPHRFVPLDVMVDIVEEKKIGQLFGWFYSTSGCTVELGNAIQMGKEIADDLLKNGISGALLTSA